MITARIVEVLLRYDEPLLVAAVRQQTQKTYLAVNAEEAVDGLSKYLVTPVAPKNLRRFLDQEVDLRFVLRSSRASHYVAVSSGEVGEQLSLERYKGDIAEYLPEPALFLPDYTGKLRFVRRRSLGLHVRF